MHEGCSDGDRDELMEVVVRLRAVTQGSVAQELSLHRNSLGQLGFHVQPDGLVTQVEKSGLAWEAGLRQNSRLIEVPILLIYSDEKQLFKLTISIHRYARLLLLHSLMIRWWIY